jgi:hypothetical protein
VSKYCITLLFLLALLFSFCDKFKKKVKVKEELPIASQEGKNTFGCMVEGEVWLPKNYDPLNSIFSSYKPITLSYYNKNLTVRAKQKTKQYTERSINIYSKNITKAGLYKLYLDDFNKTTTAYVFTDLNLKTSTVFPISDTANSNLIITKLDTVAKIISGSFSFDFILDNRTVRVRDGVFDVKLN